MKWSCTAVCLPGDEGQIGPVIDATALPYRNGLLGAAGVLLLLTELVSQQLAGPWAREWRQPGKGEASPLGSLGLFISQIIREGFKVVDNGALIAEAECRRESFSLWVQEWSKACTHKYFVIKARLSSRLRFSHLAAFIDLSPLPASCGGKTERRGVGELADLHSSSIQFPSHFHRIRSILTQSKSWIGNEAASSRSNLY